MEFKDYEALVTKTAETYRIDAHLIQAICTIESAWNTWCNRYEPAFRYSNNIRDWATKLFLSYETEEINQKTSWGLGQIMGCVARDLGFTDHLTMLCQPEIGLFYCGKKLKQLAERYHDENEIIAGYNAGSAVKTTSGMFINQVYVDKVSVVLLKLRALA